MGGGGSTTTSTSGLPDWAVPFVKDALQTSTDLYKVGGMNYVEGMSPEQVDALKKTKQLSDTGGVYDKIAQDSYDATEAYRNAASGTGLFGADALGRQTEAMKSSIGTAVGDIMGQQQGQFSRSGNLGGARAQAANSQAAMRVGGEMAANELASRRQAAMSGAGGVLSAGGNLQSQFGTGATALGGVGSAIQQQKQNEGDSAYQGVQRLFGLYGSPAIGSQTTQTGGGK